ncbi:MAG: beta strand repeat-containing protein [Planctomycetota bacterium]
MVHPTPGPRARRASSAVRHEALETRLLLSGTAYLVDSLADTVADDGVVTLREAIEAANTNTAVTADVAAGSAAETDQITFDVAALRAAAGAGNPLVITLSGTPLTITDDLDLTHTRPETLTIDAAGGSRAIEVVGQDHTAVSLCNLTVMRGRVTDDNGAGILNRGADLTLKHMTVRWNTIVASGHGAGISNDSGTVALIDTTVLDNSTLAPGNRGGGIHNEGVLTATNLTLRDNRAVWGAGLFNDGELTLTGATIRDNDASDGGGILNTGVLTATDVTIRDNRGGYGGGVWNGGVLTGTQMTVRENEGYRGGGVYNAADGTLTLDNARIAANKGRAADGNSGGGLYNEGDATFRNNSIIANAAQVDGGGIYQVDGTLTLTRTTLDGNTSGGSGGGLYRAGGAVVATELIITGNTAGGNGGGICNDGDLTITNAIIDGNTAGDAGGGIYHGPEFALTLTGVLVSENVAHDGGGGISAWRSALVLVNVAVTANASDSSGGAILATASDLMLTHVTVAGNTTTWGIGGIVGGDLRLYNSIVAANTVGPFADIDTRGTFAASHSIVGTDPGFVDPDRGDYRLTAASITVNRGDNALAVDPAGAALTEDLDGAPRVADGQVDLGAYEYRGAPDAAREALSTVVTTLDDCIDSTDGRISLRETLAYAMLGDTGATVTFTPVLAGGTITLAMGHLALRSDVTVEGPAAGVTLDAAGRSGVMEIVAGASVSLSNLTLTGGGEQGWSRGGLRNLGTATLAGLVIRGNTARVGGGIYNEGTLTVSDSRISENHAARVEGGGGIYNTGTLTVIDSILRGNTAIWAGGGIYNTGDLVVRGSTLTGNTAGNAGVMRGFGGGIHSEGGAVLVIDSTIAANSVASFQLCVGAGISVWEAAHLTVVNSILRDNTGQAPTLVGGGLHAVLTDVTFVGTLITGNDAWNGAAVAFNAGGNEDMTLSLANTTISGNHGSGLYAIAVSIPFNVTNSIIALNDGGDLSDPNLIVGSHNIIGTDPGFVDPAAGDYRPALGSVAIDAGDNALLPADPYDLDGDGETTEPLPLDLSGNPRVVGGQVDIGAYEVQGRPGDADRDNDVDLDDFHLLKQHFGTLAGATWATGDFDGNGAVDLDDFMLLKQNFDGAAAPSSPGVGLLAAADEPPARSTRRIRRHRRRGAEASSPVADLLAAVPLAGIVA